MKLRFCFGTLYNFADQPVPFFYVHLVYFLSIFYLPLFAYAIACNTEEGFGWIAVLLNNMFVIGLRSIARILADPYGDDLEDLAVMDYVEVMLKGTRALLEAPEVPPLDAELEERMLLGPPQAAFTDMQ